VAEQVQAGPQCAGQCGQSLPAFFDRRLVGRGKSAFDRGDLLLEQGLVFGRQALRNRATEGSAQGSGRRSRSVGIIGHQRGGQLEV